MTYVLIVSQGQHERAVVYFQRAVRVNPSYLSGVILLLGCALTTCLSSCPAGSVYSEGSTLPVPSIVAVPYRKKWLF